jgi:hypothetical protein
MLKAAWLCYFASLLAGMWFLLALTGTVGSEEIPGATYGVLRPPAQALRTETGTVTFEPNPVPARLQIRGTSLRIVALEKPTIWEANASVPMMFQICAFAIGSILVAILFVTAPRKHALINGAQEVRPRFKFELQHRRISDNTGR